MNADVFVKGLDYGTPLHRVIIQLIVANHSASLFIQILYNYNLIRA
jgi:hypothetical protein